MATPSAVSVDHVMTELEARVRQRLKTELLRHGASEALDDPVVFEDVERLLRGAANRARPGALLLPEVLGDPSSWRLQPAMGYQSHRSRFAGSLIMSIKRGVLMPILRWLFEYSRDNFERQARVNDVLFACVQELAIENARLKSRIEHTSRAVKLALVVHRYAKDLAGGSEAECREYAERLAQHHDVTVLTTCAADYVTWENRHPAGVTTIDGVSVHRFPVSHTRRLKRFADLSDVVFSGAGSDTDEEEWFRENGPNAPGLLEHLRQHGRQYDLVLFFTFRYFTSFFGLPLVADRAVLVPTAEDDPAITLRVLTDFLAKPAGFLFNTPEEQALVTTSAARPLDPAIVSGFGINPAPSPDGRGHIDALGIPREYVLYLGRVNRNKGALSLADYFAQYVDESGRDITLVYAGPSTVRLPEHHAIQSLGFVSNAVRDELLSHARALIVPSPYESLSIVLLEAWNRGIPALVNGRCNVLKGQVRRANGGLHYESPLEFSEALTYLLTHPGEATQMGAQGLAYVDREYRWPVVMQRVERLLNAVAGKRA